MEQNAMFVKDCPHNRFELEHTERGYRGRCHRCGVQGPSHAIARRAMEGFEATVKKCIRQEEKTGFKAEMPTRIES
jgi:hypothetical protein